jgi:LysM repeat protein
VPGVRVQNLQTGTVEKVADYLEVGQVPRVSRGPEGVSGNGFSQTYAVQPGDTLWSVAQRSGVTIQELIERNQYQGPIPLGVDATMIIR